MSGEDVARKAGQVLGGLLGGGTPRLPSRPNLPTGPVTDGAKKLLGSVFGKEANNPEVILKGKGPEEYYRFDVDKKGVGTIRPLEANGLTPQMKAEARTPEQLTKDLKEAESPLKQKAQVDFVNNTDKYIAGLTGKPESADIAVGANAKETRATVSAAIQQELKDAKGIPDAGQKQATIDNLNTMDRAITKLENGPAALDAYKNMSAVAAPGMAPPAPPSM